MSTQVQQPKTIRHRRLGRHEGGMFSLAPVVLMASVSTLALSLSAAYAEDISTPQTTPQVLVGNEDHLITSTVTIDATSSVRAVSLDAGYSGTFLNRGDIKVIADDDGDIDGIYVGGDLLGSLINDGTVLLDVADADDDDYYGIHVDGSVASGALVENNGSIIIDMTTGSEPDAAGIRIFGDVDGTVRNNGKISISLDDFTYSGVALDGIKVSGGVDGLIENNGEISITGSGENYDTTFYAQGIYVGDAIGPDGVVRNTGTILVDAHNSDSSEVKASGIWADSYVSGLIENTGSIDVTASGEGGDVDSASAYGLRVGGTVETDGVVRNSGTITVTAKGEDTDTDAGAYAIDVSGSVLGKIINSGTLTANAETTNGGADVTGIYVGGDVGSEGDSTGSITNSGTITVDANVTDSSSANAWGIFVSDHVYGTIANSGSITATAYSGGFYTASAIGIGIEMGFLDTSGTVTNSGTIDAKAGSKDADAHAFGVSFDGYYTATSTNSGDYFDGYVSGSLANSGTIDAQATGHTYAAAYGVDVGVVNGSIANSGSITAKSISTHLNADAYGIATGEVGETGSIQNSGTITARATGKTNAHAFGLATGDVNGSIANSGSITAKADAAETMAWAFGLAVEDVGLTGTITNSGTIIAEVTRAAMAYAWGLTTLSVDGEVTNSGLITAKAMPEDATASAYGVNMEYVSGTGSFTNSGTIIASAEATNDSQAYGIFSRDMNGTVTNTGVIKASSGPDAYAIYLDEGTGTLNLFTNGTIQGVIRVGAHDVNLTSVANGSAYYEFNDFSTGEGGGVFSTIVDGGQPWFVSDEGGDSPIYATVGTTGLDANALELAGVVGLDVGMEREFADLLRGSSVAVSRSGQSDIILSAKSEAAGFSKFVRGSYDRVTYSEPGLSQKVGVGGLFAGGVMQMQNGLGFGVSGGVVATSAKGSNPGGATYDNKSTGGLLELGLAQQAEGAIFDLGLHFGALSHENKRFVSTGGGVETARASFNSIFYGVSLGASLPIAMGDGLTVTPSARVSATQQRLGRYTETGATANASVGARKATIAEAKIGVEVAKQLESGILRGNLELLSRHSTGDGAFDVSLFGSTASGSTMSRSDSFGKIGVGYEAQLGAAGKLDLFASVNVGGGEIGGQTVSATYRFDF